MKQFKLEKLDSRSNFDYALSVQENCNTSPRGNTHCATGGIHLFLNLEDLNSLLTILKEGLNVESQSQEEDETSKETPNWGTV